MAPVIEKLRGRMLGVAALVLSTLGLSVAVPDAHAGITCDRIAATNGSDSNPGTQARPYRTMGKLLGALLPGETGCLRGGTYAQDRVQMARPDVTLTSFPGERARFVGRLWVARGADRVQVLNLDLNGRNSSNLPSPMITANDTVWRGNDVTNGHAPAICFHLGSRDYGNANRTLIEGNRIHNCGMLPAANHHHGIYILHSDDSVVRDNWIYDNADRGVQFYPNARSTRVVSNVIDGNGEGVMFAGTSDYASSENVVDGNIISNSKVRWNVESYWSTKVGTGNVARSNCLFASNPRSSYYNAGGGVAKEWGFTATNNRIADPRYVNRAGKDFRLQPGSGCAGYGPGTTAAEPRRR
jgi:hypothetical protein